MTPNGAAPADYATFFELSDDLLCILDAQGGFIAFNSAWERALGYSRGELQTMGMNGTIHPEDLPRAQLSPWSPHGVSGRTEHLKIEIRHIAKDGSIRWLLWSATADRGTNRYYSVGRDVTETRRTLDQLVESQQALMRTEARFRAAMNGSLDAVVFLECERDSTGHVTDFILTDLNEVGEQLLSLQKDAVLGKRISVIFPWIKGDSLFERYAHAVESGKVLEEEVDLSVPGVEHRWVHHQAIPFDNGVSITARDITERKQNEEELTMRQTYLREVIECSDELIYTLTAEGIVKFISGRSQEYLGCAPHDVEGKDWWSFVHPQDALLLQNFFQALRKGGKHLDCSYRVRHRDGNWRWHNVRGSSLADPEGKPLFCVAVARDITDLQAMRFVTAA